MAERLQAMGDEPSTEMLAKWREGRLGDDERELLHERAAVDPAFAKELLDALDFPEIPSEEPWDDATRDRKWQQFSERLRAEETLSAEPPQLEQTSAPLPFGRPERRLYRERWLPLAAALILGLGLGLFIPRFFSTGPWGDPPSVDGPGAEDPAAFAALGNVETFVVNLGGGPDSGGVRGGTLALGGTVGAVLLVMSATDLPASESYACRLLDSDSVEVFRRDGLVPGSGALLSI
ncbi:MAG: hypothetical protein AAFX50_21250, partial [Acidobacteriota bacterium]